MSRAARNPEAGAMLERHWRLIAALWNRFGYGASRVASVIADHHQIIRALARPRSRGRVLPRHGAHGEGEAGAGVADARGGAAQAAMSAFVLAELSVHAVRVSPKTVWVFLRAVDRDGIVGWGEATVPSLASHQALAPRSSGSPGLVGRRFDDPVDLADALGLPTALPDAAAQSALDQALIDIAARRDGRIDRDGSGRARRDARDALREHQPPHRRSHAIGLCRERTHGAGRRASRPSRSRRSTASRRPSRRPSTAVV
jgi:hypothetical protein